MKYLKKISLPNQILIGFILGILLGLFFGERVSFLSVVGNAFIRLLQMAVLPYVSFALMAGLGQMTFSSAKMLAKKGLLFLIILWVISFIIILLVPSVFPDWKSASYFSNSLIDHPSNINFLNLFIPNNPFFAYANNLVPAVVLFSMSIGIALMTIPKKDGLINGLNVINEALVKITNFIVRLAPIGVFAIAANAAGTLQIDQINKIEVYLISYIALSLITAFYIFPALVTLLTPITYRDILNKNKGLLITAFATANLFVVISLLITRNKELLGKYNVPEKSAENHIGVLIPTAINFPNAGKLFSLTFIGFAAWFSGTTIAPSAIPEFILLGFSTFFGNTVAALEFLMNYFKIPIDPLQLFFLTDIVISRFGTLLAAMFYISLSLLVTYGTFEKLKFKLFNFIKYAIISIGLLAVTTIGLKLLFKYGYNENYVEYNNLIQMDLLNKNVPTKEIFESTVLPDNPYLSSLESIQERGYLRIGYFANSLPYVFRNQNGKLVGFDIDLANALASDINVKLEFLKIKKEDFDFALENNIVDLVISGVMITPNQTITYTEPYTKVSFAFLVPDYKRVDFESRKAVKSQDSLNIGCINIPYYSNKIRNYLPDAEIKLFESPRTYLEGKTNLDAFVYSAEAGSAWTIVYPAYSVAVPYPDIISAPIGMAISKNNINFAQYLNTWIQLKQHDQTILRLTNYWIYGKSEKNKKTRWNLFDQIKSQKLKQSIDSKGSKMN